MNPVAPDKARRAGARSASAEADAEPMLALLKMKLPVGPRPVAARGRGRGADARPAATGDGGAASVAGPLRPALKFLTEPDSPFEDGYSIRLEEAALAAVVGASDFDEAHPDYDRWLELDERKLAFRKLQQTWELRSGSDRLLSGQEAEGMRRIGALVDEEPDQMEIHTKEGYRMFMGRSRDPAGAFAAIVGGKRIASTLKRLWILTSINNPYADWALIRHDQHMHSILARLKDETQAGQKVLDEAKKRGLNYGVVRSVDPRKVALGFKSPYGYSMSGMVVDFDYYVRVMRSLERKHLRTDDQVRGAIRDMTRFIRARLNEIARFERWLVREEFTDLSRVDFTAAASDEGRKRAEAAKAIFGLVPSEVFSGDVVPEHSRRRVTMTPADRRLLQEASAALKASEAGEGEGLTGSVADAEGLGGEAGEEGLL